MLPTNDLPQRSTVGAPPAPSRVRMIRPQFYRSSLTGSLPPAVRDLFLAITTLCDDEGMMLWEPAEIAAYVYSYQPARRRLQDFERRAQTLIDVGLVDVKPCGCAHLPTLVAHHGIKGGKPTSPIWAWHQRHAHVGERGTTGDHDTVSGSDSASSSDSVQGSGSSSSRAREGDDSDHPDGYGPTCDECHRPTSIHLPKCSRSPHLRAVG